VTTKSSYILVLGCNLGNCHSVFTQALTHLEAHGLSLKNKTEPLVTPPGLYHLQSDFLNQGVLVETDLTPEFLLDLCKNTEERLGRKTSSLRYGPREIDIDIVWWSQGTYRSTKLEIPHRWNLRRDWVRRFISELIPVKHPDYRTWSTMTKKNIRAPGDFTKKKADNEKITMLTAYDFSMAKILHKSSIDTILVGDSLGNVIQGGNNTINVSLEDIIYHSKAVKKGAPDLFVTADMPFLSYHISPEEAIRNAGKVIQATGVDAVKMEGAGKMVDTIARVIDASIPVMGHIGLQPQSVLALGGYHLQGKSHEEAERLVKEAIALEKAGAFAIVLEMVPPSTGKMVSDAVSIPIIGIGAGNNTDGQVLVINDMLGFDPDFKPSFVRTYANIYQTVLDAVENYNRDVRNGEFPGESGSQK